MVRHQSKPPKRAHKIMEIVDTESSANECRTKHSQASKCSYLVIIFIAIASLLPINAKATVDFDNVDTLWFKDAIVDPIATNQSGYNNTVPLIKLHGFKGIDADDGIRVRPTFSKSDCNNNEGDLQIVNDIFASAINRSTDLLLALNNLDFGKNANAYLCIKNKYDDYFQHMGANSKFSK